MLSATERGRYLEPTLDWALSRSRLSARDRAFATHLSYGTLQRRLYLDHVLAPRLKSPEMLPLAVRWILRLGSYERLFMRTPDYAAVHAWVELAKKEAPRLAPLVNAVLRRVEDDPGAPAWVKASLPAFLWRHWEAFFGEIDFAHAFNEPPPLWVTAFPGAEDALSAEGVPFEPGPIPGSLKLGVPNLRALAAYKKGLIQPQNPASLFAAQLVGARPGERVLDLAGGAGIKAAWLAATGARVVSYDLNPKRQAAGQKNLRRLGQKVTFKTHDLRQPLAETAPRVLLDAPCAGTGTLRHHPELRYRLEPKAIRDMADLQRRLLDTAAAAVKPGGRLVYAVCSLTEDEGEAAVRDFLKKNPAFTPEPIPGPLPWLRKELGAYVRPEQGLDGFYYARFRRAPLPSPG